MNRLNAEIRVALASSAVLERFQKLGAEAVASTPEEFRELSRRETAKWAARDQGFGRQAGLSVARPFDILIRGADIVDGTGAPRYAGDIGIRGDRIERIGDLAGSHGAYRDRRLAGRIAAPGFIDCAHARRPPAAVRRGR